MSMRSRHIQSWGQSNLRLCPEGNFRLHVLNDILRVMLPPSQLDPSDRLHQGSFVFFPFPFAQREGRKYVHSKVRQILRRSSMVGVRSRVSGLFSQMSFVAGAEGRIPS